MSADDRCVCSHKDYNTFGLFCTGVLDMVLKDETALSIGMISLAIGILVGRFTSFEVAGFPISAFVEGVLTGLSLVMNLYYLVRRSKKSRSQS